MYKIYVRSVFVKVHAYSIQCFWYFPFLFKKFYNENTNCTTLQYIYAFICTTKKNNNDFDEDNIRQQQQQQQ